MRRVYICAPFEINNLEQAEALAEIVIDALEANVAPVCPALMYADFIGVTDQENILLSSLAWLAVCDEIWVFGPGDAEPTTQQITEMTTAKQLRIPIIAQQTHDSTKLLPLFTTTQN